MNNIFVVTSSIETKNAPLTYSSIRTIFSAEERFRQTLFTINSIRNSFPSSKIVIVDSSENYSQYKSTVSYFANVDYIPLKELDKRSFEIVNNHGNKSLCESLLLNSFYKNFKKELKSYDYIIKACGRYFYFDFNDSLFNEHNTDKIFYKKPLRFEWNDNWNYKFVDRRGIQKDNFLYQYCTVLYAFGSNVLDKMIDINTAAVHLLDQKAMCHYDIETLSYYFTRPFEKDVIETDWKVSGWDGTSGRFMYY
jgi:hypothetical protein